MTAITTTLRAHGANEQQRVIFMALFAKGIEGRRGLPYIVVGPPGSAKTSILRQLARFGGLPSLSMMGSIRSPVDFLGLPFKMVQKLTQQDEDFNERTVEVPYTHYAPPKWALDLSGHGRALAIYDEFNTCSLSVQNSMLRVMFEGVVGEFPLPPGVRQLGAMNPIDQATGGRELSLALQNRLGILDWPAPTAEEFARHHLGGGQSLGDTPLDAKAEEAAFDAAFERVWPTALGEVCGFVKRRPEFMSKLPTAPGVPWTSSRSLELAMRALAGSYVYGLSASEQMLAVTAFIGSSAYGEFVRWRKEADLPDPAELLDGTAHFEHSAARIDRTAAVLTSCTALVTPSSVDKRKERIEALWRLLRDLPDACLDLAVPSVTSLVRLKEAKSATAYKAMSRLEPVMSAAGVLG